MADIGVVVQKGRIQVVEVLPLQTLGVGGINRDPAGCINKKITCMTHDLQRGHTFSESVLCVVIKFIDRLHIEKVTPGECTCLFVKSCLTVRYQTLRDLMHTKKMDQDEHHCRKDQECCYINGSN